MDGNALLEAGYPAAAAAAFRKTISLQPAASYYNLGIAFKDLGRAQDSVTSYIAALEHTGARNFASCHFNLGRAFQMLADSGMRAGYLRRHQERRDILLRAAHHFRRAGSHRSLEEVLRQLGDEPSARRAYVEHLRQNPQDGVRQRRSVPCERMRELLAQDAERFGPPLPSAMVVKDRLPPATLCTPGTGWIGEAAGAETSGTVINRLRASFGARGYATIPPRLLLPEEARGYAAMHYRRLAARAERRGGFYRDTPNPFKDRQHDSFLSKGRWAVDNDPLGLFLAERLAPFVANVTGVPVRPGFAKAAWYTSGSKLPPHRDQVQNLFSISLVLDASDARATDEWPLQLLAAPTSSAAAAAAAHNRSRAYATGGGRGHNHARALRVATGGGLIFMGRDFMHHRPCCLGRGTHALVLLLHFVPHAFPTVGCNLRLDTSASEVGSLRYDCVPLPMESDVTINGVEPGSSSLLSLGEEGVRRAGVQHAELAAEQAAEQAEERAEEQAEEQAAEVASPERDEATKGDSAAHAWVGPLHDWAPAATRREEQYLVYSPCVTAKGDDEYCLGQLNNQLHLLHHALAVSRATQRTLVLPPFLWMANQSAPRQEWFNASDFLDVCALRRHHPVVEWHAFAAAMRRRGAALPRVLMPPYLVPASDPAYSGRFFERRGARLENPRLISPFPEAVQATSGRGDEPFEPLEGLGFWRAAALHAGRQQRELAALLVGDGGRGKAERDGYGLGAEAVGAVGASVFGSVPESVVTSALSRHASTLLQWRELARDHAELVGDPLLSEGDTAGGRYIVDALTFDYAPSYNFQLDCFAFDDELRLAHRATSFAPRLHELAQRARRDIFAGGEPYLAAHVRRDGYDRYCAGDGGALKGSVFKGRRFGVRVTAEMCFPSIQQIAESLRLLMARHGLREVLLATNEQDAAELDRLRSLVPFRRWSPPTTLPPELIPLVELLLCREAEAFIGTFPSTFSTTILAQRDVRGANRSTTSFFGALDFFL